MGHLFDVSDARAEVVIRTRDHCPPHVHAFCRSEGWEARVAFSFLENRVELMELTVARGGRDPGLAVSNLIKRAVQTERALCREKWWQIYETTCLENKWLTGGSEIGLATAKVAGARQVQFARYNPTNMKLQIGFNSGGGPVEMEPK
jgi:hypothetical protein